ncbi:hypothetical protein ZIOFF_016066 [Zingiber officinale]|uniref:PHD finger protein ALFIN-LIKE n=1 Tax=Zingiber officinale TaxID=94328 RepID=A0A8J5HS66_ZINOF|nr:hypothetical protein ZIOFF_016066 [Zingiber officinale]
MDGGGATLVSHSPEDVFRDFRGRRAGMIKALTTEVEKFYHLCDPEKENLSLYGFPNETWEVNLPAEEVPPELPEPALGINFARDGMTENDWLALVAIHSDSWLLAVAFYFSARFGFDKESRSSEAEVRKSLPSMPPYKDDEDDIREGHEDFEEHDNTLCGACGENYGNDEFWICCDICEQWFHGKCVKITPARAEHIKQYKCPSCSNSKRIRA